MMIILVTKVSLMFINPLWDITGTMNIIYVCNAAHLGRRGIRLSLLQRQLINFPHAEPQGLSPIQQFTLRMDVR